MYLESVRRASKRNLERETIRNANCKQTEEQMGGWCPERNWTKCIQNREEWRRSKLSKNEVVLS
jgi:hypothetical protein